MQWLNRDGMLYFLASGTPGKSCRQISLCYFGRFLPPWRPLVIGGPSRASVFAQNLFNYPIFAHYPKACR